MQYMYIFVMGFASATETKWMNENDCSKSTREGELVDYKMTFKKIEAAKRLINT